MSRSSEYFEPTRGRNSSSQNDTSGSIVNVGASDLDPFYPGSLGPSGYGGFGPSPQSGGSLVGPGHPIFGAGPSGPMIFPGFNGGGFYGGGSLPGGVRPPRFDPLVPPTGPIGPNLGGGNPFGPFPGRGTMGGRRQPGRGCVPILPGEPQPDHLQPPNDDNNMYM